MHCIDNHFSLTFKKVVRIRNLLGSPYVFKGNTYLNPDKRVQDVFETSQTQRNLKTRTMKV